MNYWKWTLRGGPPKRYDRCEVIYEWEKYSGGNPPENAIELIAWLQSLVDEVPAELRDSVHVEIDSTSGYEGSHYATLKVSYRRPETDEEFGARQAAYDAALRAKEGFERAELARLQNLYVQGSERHAARSS